MNSARTLPDLTARQVKPGAGMCTKLLYLCGHKAQSTGGFFKGRIPMRCINCNKGAEVTQYEKIFRHLKQHRSATVRDLLAYSNCPHKRLAEMTDCDGWIIMFDGVSWGHEPYRLVRDETVRAGKKVRLYRLVRG